MTFEALGKGAISALLLLRQSSAEGSLRYALLSVNLDPGTGFFAYSARDKDLLHWSPVCLNPAAVVTAIAVRRNTDLREFQLGAGTPLLNIEDGNRVVIERPTSSTSGLDDPFTRLEYQIDA